VSETFIDQPLFTSSGERIGNVTDAIVDPWNLQPEWLAVKTGRFGRASLVPAAAVAHQGDTLVAQFDKDDVKSAPKAKELAAPTLEERKALYDHFGLPVPPSSHN
jgi:hypothetical protein